MRKHLALLIIVSLTVFVCCLSYAGQLYRWVGKDGVENVSNKPPPANVMTTIGGKQSTNLGRTLTQAKSKTEYFKRKYGAVAPLFETDENGQVTWECWAAPPDWWSRSEALKFAKELLPNHLKNEQPRSGAIDGMYEPLIYSDGTKVLLSSYKGDYIGVEIRAGGPAGSDQVNML